MKKMAMVLGLAVLLPASSASAQGYGMAGCGLGSLLFGSDQSMVSQLLAMTTNSFGNLTLGIGFFGITSGTSNCTAGGVVKAEKEQAAFAEVNFQDLKRNMATGGGEFLASFSTLLGCEDAARPVFFRLTQERYEVIFPTAETTPLQMLGTVKAQMRASPQLASSCSDERAIARALGKTPTMATAPVNASQVAATSATATTR